MFQIALVINHIGYDFVRIMDSWESCRAEQLLYEPGMWVTHCVLLYL